MTASVVAFADIKRLAYVGSLPGSDEAASDAWFTPKRYIESARRAFGGEISFDPFSSEVANRNVGAVNYADGTPGHDGFTCAWSGTNIWVNPPYSRGNMQKAVDRVVSELNSSKKCNIILLCNNASDTKWWEDLSRWEVALCMTDHRIQFENSDGKSSQGNTRGQAFFALSNMSDTKKDKFRQSFGREFRKHGRVRVQIYG